MSPRSVGLGLPRGLDPEQDWFRPGQESQGLARLQVVRSGWWLILTIVVVAVAATGVYLATASKVYEAHARVLVTPVSNNDTSSTDLGLFRESADPTRELETAASLVVTSEVANRVRGQLHLSQGVRSLQHDVSASPVAQSNLVDVAARSHSPSRAKNLADAFANQFVQERTAELYSRIDALVPHLRQMLNSLPPTSTGAKAAIAAEIRDLETRRIQPDPTVHYETPADLPTSPVSPRPALSLAAALVAGLILGLGSVFAISFLDPRLRREEQLQASYQIPVLARVQRESRGRSGPLRPDELSPATRDGYQTLHAALTVSRPAASSRSVLVTGPSAGDGKSTTSINLACALAASGKRVLLVEADSRRPTLAQALGVRSSPELADVLTGRASLEDAPSVPGEYESLRVVTAGPVPGSAEGLLTETAAEALLNEAEALADWVVIDAPPLSRVPPVLSLATLVDDVLLTVRLGKSNLRDLAELSELLAQHRIRPAGFVLTGAAYRSYYYG